MSGFRIANKAKVNVDLAVYNAAKLADVRLRANLDRSIADGQVLQYVESNNDFEPATIGNSAVSLQGAPVDPALATTVADGDTLVYSAAAGQLIAASPAPAPPALVALPATAPSPLTGAGALLEARAADYNQGGGSAYEGVYLQSDNWLLVQLTVTFDAFRTAVGVAEDVKLALDVALLPGVELGGRAPSQVSPALGVDANFPPLSGTGIDIAQAGAALVAGTVVEFGLVRPAAGDELGDTYHFTLYILLE